MSDDTVYIARPACGCIAIVIVNDLKFKEYVAHDVAQAIRDGYTIQLVERQYMLDNLQRCPHKQK